MPWVRLDENAMEHRKILALSAEAFRLWVRGLAHCQKHLTDGKITHADLKTLRGVTRSRIAELTTTANPTDAPLWETVTDGFQVHDYLAWNDSRTHVLKSRALAKARMDKLRGTNAVGSREQPSERTPEQTPNERCTTPRHVHTPSDLLRKTVAEAAATDARSKRPIYACPRFVVFEWLLDDIRKLLGPNVEAFELDVWFDTLSKRADAEGLMVDKRKAGTWIYEQTVAEAERRGLRSPSSAIRPEDLVVFHD